MGIVRQQVCDILEGRDPRLLLIVGPCSIHDSLAAKEYAEKLFHLTNTVSDTFLIIMRAYFEKPRTLTGWKGMLHDPRLDGSHDIATGIRWTRQLLLDLAMMKVPAAAELLDPLVASYFGDLLSWSCIGARTSASQTHRQIASGLAMPVGFKNNVDGNVKDAINGILCAAQSHTFMGINNEGRISKMHTLGNKRGHVVLRGGIHGPNYDASSVSHALQMLAKVHLPLRLLIDCSHDNSSRNHEVQIDVFHSVLRQVAEGNRSIRGVLLESHLHEGHQSLSLHPTQRRYAVSITDSCLGWEATEDLIKWGYALLNSSKNQKYDISNLQEKLSCIT
jgi:3-deoxy-7-phosphoheptulonate synthase